MKKVMLMLVIAILGLGLMSCEKEELVTPQKEDVKVEESGSRLKSVTGYDGAAAATYARQYTDNTGSFYITSSYNNAEYRNFVPNDCANYVSQCLEAGGLPYKGSYPTSNDGTWWYSDRYSSSTGDDQASLSWRYANKLRRFLVLNHNVTSGYISSKSNYSTWKSGLDKGDLVFFDYEDDGIHDHVMIVTDSNYGTIEVSGHTMNQKDVNLWYVVEYAFDNNPNCKLQKLQF